ncbi:transient receptor potential cation channel subfamily M member 3 [Saccoglossus kowalevskii]
MIVAQKAWIEKTFSKKECVKFIGGVREPRRCGCGKLFASHAHLTQTTHLKSSATEKWSPEKHTVVSPTDSYGLLEFKGSGQANKAQYIRLSHDTPPESMLELLREEWKLELPKLVISIHGGIQDFDLQPKLKRVFSKGLQKAAKTTGAWVLTGGTNTGVTVHVGDSLNNRSVRMRGRTVTIGIAPWGVLLNRDNLLGRDAVKPYYTVPCPTSKGAILNSSHTHFLLVDNGTAGCYGAEIKLRRHLEKYISKQRISSRSRRCVPVVCVVVEGGPNTIRSILTMVTDMPPIPIVVCDGSGRAADLIAFVHKYAGDDGTMLETLRDQLLVTIQQTFSFTRDQAEKLFVELMLCIRRRDLITVFRMDDDESEDIDLSILTALLKSQNASPLDQLSLSLAWDREDIAKKQVFVYGVEWPEGALEQVMMDALTYDRVEFVKLLMDNGVNIQKFLTFSRLEDLYNIVDLHSTLHYLARDIKKNNHNSQRYTLIDIGMVMEQLMGGAYRSLYTRKKFKMVYQNTIRTPLRKIPRSNFANLKKTVSGISMADMDDSTVNRKTETFTYPFHELMVWAVLMKRHKMALFMWQQGEEALAKALAASKLYKAMARDAEQIDIESDTAQELRGYSSEFQTLSLELLDQCYHVDTIQTQQLLTYELKNWSLLTCLSLAVSANHKEFIAHPCCQALLNDMWMGGLQMRKNTFIKVILGILLPPSILALEFKSKEELQLMPQTIEEHYQDLQETADKTSLHDAMEMDEQTGMMASGIVNAGQKAAMILGVQDDAADNGKKSKLRLGKKIYEFYNAPVTKFWAHTMAYILYLAIFNYVVLVRMESTPRWQECYIIIYIITLAIEKTRELFQSETGNLSTKVKIFYSDYWNIIDTMAILLFIVGIFLRFNPPTMATGRVIYCIDIIFWYIRLLDIMSVNKYLGPYVTMIPKMVVDMIYILLILTVILMSFGVAKQAILKPDEDPHWLLAREIFFQPYFMLYGEVFAPEIDPPCGDDPDLPACMTGHWITPIIMTLFLLVANILIINLIIATFNNTFAAINAMSRIIWKFQRYRLVMEYEQTAVLAPPLMIISHIYTFFRFLFRRCRKFRPTTLDRGLKLFLTEEDVEKVFDFEEECMEYYFRTKQEKMRCSDEIRIAETHECTDAMSLKLDEVNEKNNRTKLTMHIVDQRLTRLEQIAMQTITSVHSMEKILTSQLCDMVLSPRSAAVEVAEAVTPRKKEVLQSHSEEVCKSAKDRESISPISLSVDSSPQQLSKISSKESEDPMKKLIAQASDETTTKEKESTHSEEDAKMSFKSKLERQHHVYGTKDQSDVTSPSPEKEKPKKVLKKKRKSTFERWASMQGSAQSADEQSDEEFKPPIRQISQFGKQVHSAKGLPVLQMPLPSEATCAFNRFGPDMRMSSLLHGGAGNVNLLPMHNDSRRSSDSAMSAFSFSSFTPDDPLSRIQIPKPKPYTSVPTYSSITDTIDTSVFNNSIPVSPLTNHDYHTITNVIDTTTAAGPPSPPTTPLYRNANPDYDINRYSSRAMMPQFSSDPSVSLKLAEQRDYELMEDEVHCKIHSTVGKTSMMNRDNSAEKVEFRIGGKKIASLQMSDSDEL